MSDSQLVSEEQLQAFVDGQLDAADQGRLLLALERSPELRAGIAELRELRDRVRLAYQHLPVPPPADARSSRPGGYALAATAGALVMLVATQLLGWFPSNRAPNSAASLAVAPVDLPAQLVSDGPELVMFHISTADEQAATLLLDQVELVATRFRTSRRALRVVVIANNQGLQLYRALQSSQAQRIRQLFARFDNITFAACGTTLARLTDSGDAPRLLPQAIVVDSGVAEIARRQKQGWKYIRI